MRSGLILLFLFMSYMVPAQPVPDEEFDYALDRRAYLHGPKIIIDEGHNNLHKKDGGLLGLVRMLTADGYRISSNSQTITAEVLKEADVYVIVNALHDSDVGSWVLPNPSAFTEEEIAALHSWVRGGGSVLLVADHMPYGGAAQALGKALGVEWNNGFAIREGQHWPPSVFSRDSGTLKSTRITDGRLPFERINEVATFTGSVFKAPPQASTFLVFDDSHTVLMPDTAWQFSASTPQMSAEGWQQGAFFELGAGKVVVLGEAAMITAQLVNNGIKVGMNSPQAPENAQLALNLFHYLSGHEQYINQDTLLDANLRAMETAFREGDMREVAGFYADDAQILGPGQNDQQGRAEIDAYWMGVKGREVDWKLTSLQRREIGDEIHEIGISEMKLLYQGAEVTATSRFYLVWELRDGRYRITLDFYHKY